MNRNGRRSDRARGGKLALTTALTLGAFIGCGEKQPTPTGPDPLSELDPATFLSDSMPVWDAFSPPLADIAAGPDSASRPATQVTLDVEVVEVDGTIDTLANQTYVCTETPYSVTDTPERLVMYSPQASILWAGGFIQGRSRAELGSLDGLVVDERAPIDVVIQGVLGVQGGVSETVEAPNLANVSQAVNDLVGNASTNDLETASEIVFKLRTYHSEEEVGLSIGASGRYLGFAASSGYQSNIAQSETTVTAEFFEKMFTIVVAPPSTPAGFFTDALTGELLRTKYGGQIGPENPPLYISEIVYGRSLMYSMTSTASEADIRATMKASFDAIAGSANVQLSARQETLLRESKVSVVAIGGSQSNVLSLIRSNSLSAYFEDGAPLTTAAPLSYTFSTLRGETAHVSETSEYVLRECAPRGTGSLTFKDTQVTQAPIGGSFSSVAGDFNGDDYGDLVWNTLNGATNEFFVGYGQVDGTFRFGGAIMHPEAPSIGWGEYELLVTDLDRDGSDDLVWSAATIDTLSIYAAKSAGESFTFAAETAAGGGWQQYDVVLGYFDDDSNSDIAYNRTDSGHNRWVFGEGDGSGTFALGADVNLSTNSGWGVYRPAVTANVDNDVVDEVILQKLDSENAVWTVQLNQSTKQFELYDVSSRGSTWLPYDFHVGDIDGALGADIFNWQGNDGVHMWRSDGDGTFSPAAYDFIEANGVFFPDYVGHVGDLNDDGKSDLVLNRLTGNENSVVVAFGTSDFDLSIPGGVLEHALTPANGWDLYETRILDVNGDGKDDVVWAIPQGDLTIHVGLAR